MFTLSLMHTALCTSKPASNFVAQAQAAVVAQALSSLDKQKPSVQGFCLLIQPPPVMNIDVSVFSYPILERIYFFGARAGRSIHWWEVMMLYGPLEMIRLGKLLNIV